MHGNSDRQRANQPERFLLIDAKIAFGRLVAHPGESVRRILSEGGSRDCPQVKEPSRRAWYGEMV
jgi:hypothetical protein